MKLNAKREAFVREYLVDMNGAAAAVRAGFAPARAAKRAMLLRRDPVIASAIETALAERAQRVQVEADEVLRELAFVGLSDIGDVFDENGRLRPLAEMSEATRRSISSIEVEDIFEGRGANRERIGVVVKVRLWDKTRGLEMLGKIFKLFTEVHEVKLTDLGERLRQARERVNGRAHDAEV